jgi:hypothetical protein
LFGAEETVDRREGEVRELEVAVVHVVADPRGKAPREPHRDAVLGPADGGKRHGRAGVECLDELGEGPLVDAAHRPARRLAVQALGGLDHLVVQAFREKKAELLGGTGHGELSTDRA